MTHPLPPWLGLEQITPDSSTIVMTDSLARFDSQLYGGSGLAALVAAVTRRTGRSPLWASVQFVGTAVVGETLRLDVEVLAEGRATTQARITATVGDRLVLAGLASSGSLRTEVLEAGFGTMPPVGGPDDAESWDLGFLPTPDAVRFGPFHTAEFRRAPGPDDITRLWVRMVDGPHSHESIAYVADFVPGSVVRAAGRSGVGTSLDNTIRFGPPPATEWVLIDIDPYFAHGGFVHGAARIWAPDGTLLALASQTARARLFD